MADPSRGHAADSYRPRYRDHVARPPSGPSEDMYHFRGNADSHHHDRKGRGGRRPPNHNFRFRAPTKIYERPLLQERDDKEEQYLGNTNAQEKFRDVNDLTDSDEAEMEDSEDDDEGRSKRIKIDDSAVSTAQASKWSNPDPYTSLPAPNETTGKKMDFVKMIRKARNDINKSATDANANAADFISFGDGPASEAERSDRAEFSRIGGLNENLQRQADDDTRALGKRKRGEANGTRSKVKITGSRGSAHKSAMILYEWSATGNGSSAPWWRLTNEKTAGVALHKEILDYYDWIKPQDFEFAVRGECIKRLSDTLSRFKPGELKAFGSYGAGLFLPTGDMDLVFLDRSFLHRVRAGYLGISTPISRNQFHQWLSFIRNQGIARPGSIVPIPGAKVPIIKFVDRVSGLKIDLSFNNDTGLVANETFQKWKRQYPAMPIIVSIIKQYLMIRGLNDVSTGGLGGFSTICLATSLVQHMPATGSSQNLGEILVQFFNVYGNLLDRENVAIRMEPPGYIDKASYAPHLFNKDKKGRLTIIDPHRPDNNISGGTSEIQLIADSFAEAYDVLQGQLASFDSHSSQTSLLESLIGGAFDAYEDQRSALHRLYSGPNAKPRPSMTDPVPPPPPPPAGDLDRLTPSPPPPPPLSEEGEPDLDDTSSARERTSTNGAANKSKPTRSEKLARRLKKLRPDLAGKIESTITRSDAVRIAGYKDYQELAARLKSLDCGAPPRASAAKGKAVKSGSGSRTMSGEQRALRSNRSRPELAS